MHNGDCMACVVFVVA